MQSLKVWAAPAPKLREPIEQPPVPVAPISKAHSSQDGIEPAEPSQSLASVDTPASHDPTLPSVEESRVRPGSTG
jgi:hypothetical protein